MQRLILGKRGGYRVDRGCTAWQISFIDGMSLKDKKRTAVAFYRKGSSNCFFCKKGDIRIISLFVEYSGKEFL